MIYTCPSDFEDIFPLSPVIKHDTSSFITAFVFKAICFFHPKVFFVYSWKSVTEWENVFDTIWSTLFVLEHSVPLQYSDFISPLIWVNILHWRCVKSLLSSFGFFSLEFCKIFHTRVQHTKLENYLICIEDVFHINLFSIPIEIPMVFFFYRNKKLS